MEALRNYVQHRGFPVHTLTFNHQRVERQGESFVLNSVSPSVEPARLQQEDGEFKKPILAEMEACGEKLDLKELIRDYVEGLSIAHSEIRGRIGQCTKAWDALIKDAIQRYATENPNENTLGLCAVKRLEDQRYSDSVPVFTDPIDQRRYFESKNGALTNLTKQFITSEVIR